MKFFAVLLVSLCLSCGSKPRGPARHQGVSPQESAGTLWATNQAHQKIFAVDVNSAYRTGFQEIRNLPAPCHFQRSEPLGPQQLVFFCSESESEEVLFSKHILWDLRTESGENPKVAGEVEYDEPLTTVSIATDGSWLGLKEGRLIGKNFSSDLPSGTGKIVALIWKGAPSDIGAFFFHNSDSNRVAIQPFVFKDNSINWGEPQDTARNISNQIFDTSTELKFVGGESDGSSIYPPKLFTYNFKTKSLTNESWPKDGVPFSVTRIFAEPHWIFGLTYSLEQGRVVSKEHNPISLFGRPVWGAMDTNHQRLFVLTDRASFNNEQWSGINVVNLRRIDEKGKSLPRVSQWIPLNKDSGSKVSGSSLTYVPVTSH